jgi:hypothetical protein
MLPSLGGMMNQNGWCTHHTVLPTNELFWYCKAYILDIRENPKSRMLKLEIS